MSNEIAFGKPACRRDARRADDAGGRAGDEDECGMRSRFVERRDAAGRAHHQRLGQPGTRRSRRERAQVPRRDRPEVGVGGGRSTPARTRGTPERPRARPRRAHPASGDAAPRQRHARAPGAGRRAASTPPPPPRRARAASSRSSGSRTPSGPVRSRTPTQRSSGTSGFGMRRAEPVQVRARLPTQVQQMLEARRCRRTPCARPSARAARSSRQSSRG